MVGSCSRCSKGNDIRIRGNFGWEWCFVAGNRGAQYRAGNANAGQGKPIKCYNSQENGAVLDEEELLFLADECDALDSDVDDEPTAQSIFMANLSPTGPANLQAVQQKHVIDSNGADMGNSNVIPYKQYLTINEVFVEPSCASSLSNDAYMLHDNNAYIPHDPLVTELNIYKQQVAIYEQRAKFDLTLRE
ncbi:hypothetical protein Tco_1439987 [Tanacetum coccineum]